MLKTLRRNHYKNYFYYSQEKVGSEQSNFSRRVKFPINEHLKICMPLF